MTPSSAASARRAVPIRWAPDKSITRSIQSERTQLAPIRAMADLIINTSKFTVHELRDFIGERFRGQRDPSDIRSMSPASDSVMACRRIAIWSLMYDFCRIPIIFRDLRT